MGFLRGSLQLALNQATRHEVAKVAGIALRALPPSCEIESELSSHFVRLHRRSAVQKRKREAFSFQASGGAEGDIQPPELAYAF